MRVTLLLSIAICQVMGNAQSLSFEEWQTELKQASTFEDIEAKVRQLAVLFPTWDERNWQVCIDYETALRTRAVEVAKARTAERKTPPSLAMPTQIGVRPSIGSTRDRAAGTSSQLETTTTEFRIIGVPTLRQVIGAQVQAALQSAIALLAALGEAREQNRADLRSLQDARSNFWREYPNGPNLKSAQEAYAQALLTKDLKLVVTIIIGNVRGPEAQSRILYTVLRNLEEEAETWGYDGGIAPIAQKEFRDWANYISDERRRGRKEEQAFAAATEVMFKYQERRDIAEYLFANPNSPLRHPDMDAAPYLAAVFLGIGKFTKEEDAMRRVQELEAIYGQQAIRRTAEVVREFLTIGHSSLDYPSGRLALDDGAIEQIVSTGNISVPVFCGSHVVEGDFEGRDLVITQLKKSLKPFGEDASIEQFRDLLTKASWEHDLTSALQAAKVQRDLIDRLNQARRSDLRLIVDQDFDLVLRRFKEVGQIENLVSRLERRTFVSGQPK